MVTKETFIFYIMNSNKRALYVDANGFIQESDEDLLKPDGQPAHLTYSPDGWKDMQVKYGRNVKYWGLIRDMTIPMKFPRDGFRIIANALWTEGVEAIRYMSIAKFDTLTLPYRYAKWYMTELNLPKFNQSDVHMKVDALEGGPSKWLKANENVEYEIPVEEIKVLMDGVSFDYNRVFLVAEGQQITGTANYFLGMVEASREGTAIDVYFQDILPTASTPYPNESWFVGTDRIQSMRIYGKVKIYFDKSVSPLLRVDTNEGVFGGTPQYFAIPFAAAEPALSTKEYDIDITVPMPAGTKYSMKVYGGAPADPTTQFTVLSGELQVDYVYRHYETYCESIYLYTLFQALVEKLTEGNYTGESNFLKNKKDLVYTCGNALRVLEDSKIKISFSTFFQSIPFIGCGVKGNKIIIESLETFFDDSTILLDLGEVSDANITFAEDLVGNVLKTGYPKQDYNDVNGKYEFNQGQVRSTPMLKVVKELDLMSQVRADALGAELMRINLEKKKTTDNESDNDSFMLNIETTLNVDIDGVEYYNLYRPAYSAVVALPHYETYFNTELSPTKRTLKYGRLLRSLFDFSDLKSFKITSSDKNVDLSTTLSGTTILESDPIQIGSLGDKLFLPYYLNFVTKVPVNLLELMEANQYGYVKFSWNGKPWYGFLMDGSIKPDDRDKQTWKLLSSPRNDLSKFKI